jgi:hypothetical protein
LSDPEIAALAAATAAAAGLRESAATDPDAALAAAVRTVDPDGDPDVPSAARWACALLGVALGVLPARMGGVEGRPAAPDSAAEIGAPRRRPALVAVAVVAALVLGAVLYWQVGAGPTGVRERPTPAPAPPPSAVVEASGPFAGGPANPRDAFTDPRLLAMAEPYLGRPGVRCEREPEPQIGMSEQVSCDLGGNYLGYFQSMFTADRVRAIRSAYQRAEGGQPVAETVRSLRWRSVPGRPRAKAGIPGGSRDPGDGIRVRFLDPDGYKWLYFDVDRGLQYALLATPDPAHSAEDLRAFWAEPGR